MGERLRLMILIVGLPIVLLGLVAMGLSRQNDTVESQPVEPDKLLKDARHATGSSQPKVTMVEFSDFQCPACRDIEPELKAILSQYPTQVGLVYRHLPLTLSHRNAQLAAEAAEAAAVQGKFWEFHDILFERQDEWAEEKDVLNRFVAYAEGLDLNTALFLQTVRDGAYKDRVENDVKLAGEFRVNSTPTFFVNGVKVGGAAVKKTVEELLKSL